MAIIAGPWRAFKTHPGAGGEDSFGHHRAAARRRAFREASADGGGG